MKKRKTTPGKIINHRARYDYELGDSLVVGLVLTGPETKALRMGQGNLVGAYVTLKNDELWLINAQIFGTAGAAIDEDDKTRSRKLLAKASEIKKLVATKGQGQAIIPLEFITRGRFVKLRIAAGRGKKRYDKREVIKKRQQERDSRQQIG